MPERHYMRIRKEPNIEPALKIRGKFAYLAPVVLGVLFGTCSFVGCHEGTIDERNIILYADICFFIALFVLIFRCSLKLMEKVPPHFDRLDIPFSFFRHLKLDWTPKSVVAVWGMICVCWLPYAIIFFPGTYWFDTSWQLTQFFDPNTPITDHHPFALTYVLGFFCEPWQSHLS